MKHRLPFIVAFSLFILSTVFTAPVWAQVANLPEIQQASVGLTAIPPRLGDDGSLQADPGQTIQTQVRVRNTTNRPLPVKTLVEDFIIGEDGRTPVPVTDQIDSRWSLAQWIEIPQTEATIPVGASQTYTVIIRVPENALPGGRYAMIMHEPVSGEKGSLTGETAGQTGIQQRVGSLVYLRVKGDVHEEAYIRNLSIPLFQEFGPVPMKFSVENLSDMHIAPKATVTIRNLFGIEKSRVELPVQNVFPLTMREFSSDWDRVWAFGRYTAQVEVAYGEKGQIATAQTHFWVVPVKLLLALGVLVLALIGIGVAVRRHLHHRDSVEQQHIMLLEDRIRQLEGEIHNQHE